MGLPSQPCLLPDISLERWHLQCKVLRLKQDVSNIAKQRRQNSHFSGPWRLKLEHDGGNIVEPLFANASPVSWLDMAPQMRWGHVLLCAHSAQSPIKFQEEAPQAVVVIAVSVRNLCLYNPGSPPTGVGVCKELVWHVRNAGHHHRLTWSTHDACQANSVHCAVYVVPSGFVLLAPKSSATAIVTFCIHRSIILSSPVYFFFHDNGCILISFKSALVENCGLASLAEARIGLWTWT